MAKVNRQYKDRLFCHVFSIRENALQLYNALNGSNYKNPEDLELVSLEDAVYLSMKNDVAVLLSNTMQLFEHQSTQNPNMPLRGFLYFAREYEGWLASNDKDVYGSALVQIPSPRCLVFYNGRGEAPDYRKLRLSDAFAKPAEGYEWTAEVYNINLGHNEELMEACKVLRDYARFTDLIRTGVDEGLAVEAAARKASRECIDRGIMREYLQKHEGEVFDMILTEYNEELHERTLRAEGRAEGWAEGRAEGRAEGKAEGIAAGKAEGREELVSVLRDMGLSEGDIRERMVSSLGVSPEEAEELLRAAAV